MIFLQGMLVFFPLVNLIHWLDRVSLIIKFSSFSFSFFFNQNTQSFLLPHTILGPLPPSVWATARKQTQVVREEELITPRSWVADDLMCHLSSVGRWQDSCLGPEGLLAFPRAPTSVQLRVGYLGSTRKDMLDSSHSEGSHSLKVFIKRISFVSPACLYIKDVSTFSWVCNFCLGYGRRVGQ